MSGTGNRAPTGIRLDLARVNRQRVDPVTWAYTARKVWAGDNLAPLDHTTQPYMIEPLIETANRIEEGGWSAHTLTFLKGRQVGGTTAAMSLLLWYLDTYGGKVIHAVPSQENAKTIKATLTEAVADTTFRNLSPTTTMSGPNRSFKPKGGRGHNAAYLTGHLLGGNATSAGDGFRGKTARIVCFDERGQIPKESVAVVTRTLTTAPMKIVLNIGSARDTEDKLTENFLAGSRAEWVIPCAKCPDLTTLCPYGSTLEDLHDSIEGSEETGWHYACRSCRAAIDPLQGYWIHQNAGPHLSYHLSALNSPLVSAQDVADLLASPDETETDLYRETMGLPHGGEGLSLMPHDFQVVEEPDGFNPLVVGIDWGGGAGGDIRHGKSYFVTLGYREGKLHVSRAGSVGPLPHDDHVPALWNAVADQFPRWVAADFGAEGGRNDKLHRHAGQVFTVRSNLTPRPGPIREQVVRVPGVPRTYNIVKTFVYEHLANAILKGDVVFCPGTEMVRDHLTKVTPERKGRDGSEFTAYSTGSQHYAACLIYAYALYLRKRHEDRVLVGRGNPMLPKGYTR